MPLISAAMKIAAKIAVQYKTTAATQPDRTQQKTHVGNKQCCILTSPASSAFTAQAYLCSFTTIRPQNTCTPATTFLCSRGEYHLLSWTYNNLDTTLPGMGKWQCWFDSAQPS